LEEFFQTPGAFRSRPVEMIRDLGFDYIGQVFANNAEEIVRAKDEYSPGKLSYILTAFSGWHCRNPRDKVYGLLGLMHEQFRIAIDYHKSIEEIFTDAVRKVVEDEDFMGLESHMEFADMLRASLNINSIDVPQLVQTEFEKVLGTRRAARRHITTPVDIFDDLEQPIPPVTPTLTWGSSFRLDEESGLLGTWINDLLQ
jgi:hypothetical protein